MTGPADGAGWDGWIAVLERSIADYGRQLDEPAGTGALPAFVPVPPPAGAGALPAPLVPRARAAQDRLGLLAERTRARRDDLATHLATLPRVARARSTARRRHDLGDRLDVSG